MAGFNSKQMEQLAQLINGAIDMRLGTMNQAAIPAASVAPQSPQDIVELGVNPVARVAAAVPATYPMTPIYGVSGERFVELAKLGKGEYVELSNTLFALIRAQILEENGGISYDLMAKADKTELNKAITKMMSDRVNAIRKVLKAAADTTPTPVVNTPADQTPASPAPAPVVEQPRIDFSKLDPNTSVTAGAIEVQTPVQVTTAPATTPTKDYGLGPVGNKEVSKLIAEARENIKIGQSAGITLKQWFQKPTNQKRQKIALKIVEAAAAELNVKLKKAEA